MEPGGPMSHSQGLSNNPYPEPNYPVTRIDTYLLITGIIDTRSIGGGSNSSSSSGTSSGIIN